MVASAEKSPAKPKAHFGPGSPIPLAVRLAVRSFYLLQGLKPSQIAPLVGLSAPQIQYLANREGWAKQRNEKKLKNSKKAEELQNARADSEISAIHQAIAVRTEELSVKTLDHCANLLAEPVIDAKNLQMASGAARNFVQIARMSRGMDSRGPANAAQPSGNGTTLIFVGALERTTPKAEPKQADVVDIPSEQPKLGA